MNVVSNMAIFSSQRSLFGLPVCDLDWSEAFMFVSALADLPVGQTSISFVNAHNLKLMLEDADYRKALENHLVLPDGLGADIASVAFHGSAFPANLNGTDFVPALLTYMSRTKRIGLVGASEKAVNGARDAFARHAPWHEFIAVSDGFFTDEEAPAIMARVAAEKLDILLVAMGTPKQEKWVERFVRPEHAKLVITVGALFDFAAGEVPRAPKLVRRLRAEWLYRVLQEPRRLAGRYFLGGPIFLWYVAREAVALRLNRAPEPISLSPPRPRSPKIAAPPRTELGR